MTFLSPNPQRQSTEALQNLLLNRTAQCASQKEHNRRFYVTSAGWQVTLCDPVWYVSSRSGGLLTAILR